MPRPGSTPFEQQLPVAADVLHELQRLESNYKLSADAFLREAMANARCDVARLIEIAKLLEAPHGTDTVRAFVRRMASEMRKPGFTRPYLDTSKALRVWGSENTPPQLADLRVTASEACALAAKRAVEEFPDAFGFADSWSDHQAKIANARAKLDGLYATLRRQVRGEDLEIDTATLLPDEIKRGLARVTFKCAPDVTIGHPDWPKLLVAHKLATTGVALEAEEEAA